MGIKNPKNVLQLEELAGMEISAIQGGQKKQKKEDQQEQQGTPPDEN